LAIQQSPRETDSTILTETSNATNVRTYIGTARKNLKKIFPGWPWQMRRKGLWESVIILTLLLLKSTLYCMIR